MSAQPVTKQHTRALPTPLAPHAKRLCVSYAVCPVCHWRMLPWTRLFGVPTRSLKRVAFTSSWASVANVSPVCDSIRCSFTLDLIRLVCRNPVDRQGMSTRHCSAPPQCPFPCQRIHPLAHRPNPFLEGQGHHRRLRHPNLTAHHACPSMHHQLAMFNTDLHSPDSSSHHHRARTRALSQALSTRESTTPAWHRPGFWDVAEASASPLVTLLNGA